MKRFSSVNLIPFGILPELRVEKFSRYFVIHKLAWLSRAEVRALANSCSKESNQLGYMYLGCETRRINYSRGMSREKKHKTVAFSIVSCHTKIHVTVICNFYLGNYLSGQFVLLVTLTLKVPRVRITCFALKNLFCNVENYKQILIFMFPVSIFRNVVFLRVKSRGNSSSSSSKNFFPFTLSFYLPKFQGYARRTRYFRRTKRGKKLHPRLSLHL